MALACAYRAFQAPAELLIYPACILFVAVSAWCFWSWRRLCGEFPDPYILFLLATILFNGGQAILEVGHANPNGLLGNSFSSESLLNTLFFTTAGVLSLHLGALLSFAVARKKVETHSTAPVVKNHLRASRLIGLLMIAVSLLPWVTALRQATDAVMSYGYFVGLFQQNAATGLGGTPNVLGMFLLPGAFFLLAGSRRQRFGRWLGLATIGAYSAAHLFLGSRAPAIAALAACLWLYDRSVYPVRKIVLVGVTAVVLVMVPVVAAVRNLDAGRRSVDTVLGAFSLTRNPAVSTISEMGTSMSAVAYTIDLVPAARGYDMGKSYMFALLTVFPNLFWDVHPIVAHGLLGNWLIWTVDPARAAEGGGLGFSFLAEAYLNFGWYGAPLALAVIGFLVGILAKWTRGSDDAARLAAIATILSFTLILARGESASVVRGVIWYSLLPLLAVRALSRVRRHCVVRWQIQSRSS